MISTLQQYSADWKPTAFGLIIALGVPRVRSFEMVLRFMTNNIAHCRGVESQMLGNLGLPVSMTFDRFNDLLVPFSCVFQDAPRKDRIE